jgi:hypothetical protein
MRTLAAVLVCIVFLQGAIWDSEPKLPTVSAATVTLREVRRGSEASHTPLVERPFDANESTRSSVFVVDADGVRLRRVPVEYGRAVSALIEIVSGLSPGDRIVVSDMRSWDAFDSLRLRVPQPHSVAGGTLPWLHS